MATMGERVATLEEQMRNLRDDVHVILDEIGDKGRPATIRGRLHSIEGYIGSAVARRALGAGLFKGWVQAVIVFTAVATAAAAWYAAVAN